MEINYTRINSYYSPLRLLKHSITPLLKLLNPPPLLLLRGDSCHGDPLILYFELGFLMSSSVPISIFRRMQIYICLNLDMAFGWFVIYDVACGNF